MNKTMNLRIFMLSACLLAAISASGQTFQWARAAGSNGDDEGQSVSVDASGNVYTTGYFWGTVDFDPGPGTANLTSAGEYDIFVQKLDAGGNFLWARSFGSSAYDEGYAIHATASGTVYLTGSFEGTVDFDPGPGIANLSAVDDEDVFVLHLDAAGGLLWARSFGGNNDDEGYGIHVDATGNVYTTGYFRGTVDFDPGPGTATLSSVLFDDVFVQKLDPAGNFLWARSFGGLSNDKGYGIDVDASGNVYTTGTFFGPVDFDPGAGTTNLSSAGLDDIFVQKLDASGNFLWASAFGGIGADGGYAISVDAAGNAYTTGYFRGTVDFDPGAGTATLSAAGLSDIFVQKLDAAGNFLWARAFGDDDDDEGQSITLDAAGDVYTTGSFEGTVDFDPGPGTTNLSAGDDEDVFILKLDAAGNFFWAASFGGNGDDEGYGIHVDGSGNVYTTGYFAGTADVDPGAGVTNLSSAGGTDIFVHKLGQATTRIAGIPAGLNISAFPNPTDGWFLLAIEAPQDHVVVTLRDMQGREIYTRNLGAASPIPLEIPGPAGVYLLHVSMTQGHSVIRLIRQ